MAKQNPPHGDAGHGSQKGAKVRSRVESAGPDCGDNGSAAKRTTKNGKSAGRLQAVGWPAVGAAVIVVIAAVIAATQYCGRSSSISLPAASPSTAVDSKVASSSTASSKESKPKTVVDYNAYVTLSKKNKWEHPNPLDRLDYLSRMYSQTFTVTQPLCARLTTTTGSNDSSAEHDKQFSEFVSYLKQDMSFVMSALANTVNMDFDLSTMFVESLQASKRLMFKVIKELISKCNIGAVSKILVEQTLAAEIYHPVYALLQLSGASKHVHIDFNHSSDDEAPRLSPLEFAAVFRQYSVMTAICSQSSLLAINAALRQAVINSDTLAVGILLSCFEGQLAQQEAATAQSTAAESEDVVDAPALCKDLVSPLRELAQELRYVTISDKLTTALARCGYSHGSSSDAVASSSSVMGRPEYDRSSAANRNDFAPVMETTVFSVADLEQQLHSSEKTTQHEEIEHRQADTNPDIIVDRINLLSRYHSMTSTTSRTDNDATVVKWGKLATALDLLNELPVCDIATYRYRDDASGAVDINPEEFYATHVVNNRPARFIGKAMLREVAKVADWSIDTYVRYRGSAQVAVAEIPYAPIFGVNETKMTIDEFIHGPNGMKSCTKQLRQLVDGGSHNTLSQSCLDAVDFQQLPYYIFGASYEQSPPIDIVGQNHNNRDDEDKDKERERERESYLRQLLLVSSSSARPSSSTSSPRASRRRKSPHRQHQNQDQSQLLANHTKYQFYLGPPLSGAPFHSHGPAFNGLVHGQKLWFLLPPGNDIYTAMHPLRWLLQKEYIRGLYRNNRDSSGADTNTNTLLLKGPCVLLQNPDEVIYIPRHWSHQVLNLEESIGFAVEILDYI